MKTSAIVLQVSVNFFLRKCSIGFVFIFGFRCDPLYPVFQRFTPDFCPHGFETLAFGLARCICSRGVIYKVIRGGSARVSVFNFRSSRGWLKICLSLRVHVLCVCVSYCVIGRWFEIGCFVVLYDGSIVVGLRFLWAPWNKPYSRNEIFKPDIPLGVDDWWCCPCVCFSCPFTTWMKSPVVDGSDLTHLLQAWCP